MVARPLLALAALVGAFLAAPALAASCDGTKSFFAGEVTCLGSEGETLGLRASLTCKKRKGKIRPAIQVEELVGQAYAVKNTVYYDRLRGLFMSSLQRGTREPVFFARAMKGGRKKDREICGAQTLESLAEITCGGETPIYRIMRQCTTTMGLKGTELSLWAEGKKKKKLLSVPHHRFQVLASKSPAPKIPLLEDKRFEGAKVSLHAMRGMDGRHLKYFSLQIVDSRAEAPCKKLLTVTEQTYAKKWPVDARRGFLEVAGLGSSERLEGLRLTISPLEGSMCEKTINLSALGQIGWE